MDFLFVLAGLVLLFVGGEGLVRGSVAISKRLGISIILIGVVVVGFGTSAPELLVSIKASLNGQPDIALGNVVGSNIANVLLILGIASLLSPVVCKDKAILRDAFAVFVASVALWLLSYMEVISAAVGTLMVLSLILYLFYSYKSENKDKARMAANGDVGTVHEHEAQEFDDKLGMTASVLMSVAGIAMLVFGADLLVRGASNIARDIGISEAVIGLSLVAVGTSLPELATAISAAIKKNSDVVIGNILGSNMFNILSILGITAMIKPVPIAGQIAAFDIPLALGISVVMLTIIFFFRNIGRVSGGLFLLSYVAYIAWLYLSDSLPV